MLIHTRQTKSAISRLADAISKFEITLPVPIFGLGCGVLGLSMGKVSLKMGQYAADLLRALEYRGFDSTGAAFQGDTDKIVLLKDKGAPSRLVKTLGIEKQSGRIFCGQVRWATFGAVDKANAQPHEVKCKRHIYGAHNGNIINTDELIDFYKREGHEVKSFNDGEAVVHTIEHYFDIELKKAKNPQDFETIRACMRRAIITGTEKVKGSYAAVIVEPITKTSWAIKSGSSLYFGVGVLEDLPFGLASSDLTSVLRFTKMIVNLREGEFIEYTHDAYQVYAAKDLHFKEFGQTEERYQKGDPIGTRAAYSRLRAEDVELLPEFEYFMEQEIFGQPESVGKLIKVFQHGSNTGKRMLNLINKEKMYEELNALINPILDAETPEKKEKIFGDFCASKKWEKFYKATREHYPAILDVAVKEDFDKKYFFSNFKNIFIDLIGEDYDLKKVALAKALDSISELASVVEFEDKIQAFLELLKDTLRNKRIAYTVACGTSYHATKVAALFFNEIAGVEIIPILPGEFRGEYSNCIKDNDIIIGVSQSGETKDLIDIFNDIIDSGRDVRRVAIVNNHNSTLGQEKSDVAIPILCGPEIAVPATKSFMNQLVIFYYLAIRTAEIVLDEFSSDMDPRLMEEKRAQLKKRRETLPRIPDLIKQTLDMVKDEVTVMAAKIYMEPSLHILATKISGVAMEGALKIRETVLNHAEGREASEFKHGPNTILGKNTVFGFKHVRTFVRSLGSLLDNIDKQAQSEAISRDETKEIIGALGTYLFYGNKPLNLSKKANLLFEKIVEDKDFYETIYRNYPLIYVTGPSERDVNLTISQINTHKIRGANTFVIAEENEKLLRNANQAPVAGKFYDWQYIVLPRTGDSLLTCFSATAVLQLLAFKMSLRKMTKLDRVKMLDHGVHPDVPKNVSKSITVD